MRHSRGAGDLQLHGGLQAMMTHEEDRCKARCGTRAAEYPRGHHIPSPAAFGGGGVGGSWGTRGRGRSAPPPVPRAGKVIPPPVPRAGKVIPPPVPRASMVFPPPVPRASKVLPPPVPRAGRVLPPPVPRAGKVLPPPVPRASMAFPPPVPQARFGWGRSAPPPLPQECISWGVVRLPRPPGLNHCRPSRSLRQGGQQ